MEVKFSEQPGGVLGISGHVGVGHVHSHSGFVQDDSAGLAVAALILKKALPVDTVISEVQASMEEGRITVRTNGGGEASASPRRGIAPFEKELLESRGVIWMRHSLRMPPFVYLAACTDRASRRRPPVFRGPVPWRFLTPS